MLNKEEVLIEMHRHNRWPEELLGKDFYYLIREVLSTQQKQILEMKVEGFTNEFIAGQVGAGVKTVGEMLSRIKRKRDRDWETHS